MFFDQFVFNLCFWFLNILEQYMQYLDENKSLILKIVESQNSGKMAECAE